jgi:NAD(P)-dependent dehydrogenase (short-subunit alcohol dehydrogenase family)
MQNSQDLSGRHAVVTGGAAGLGLAIAQTLADAGARLTVVDLGAALAAAALPADWRTAALDLGAADSLDAQSQLARDLGDVDIVVANAGVVPPWRGVAELDAAEWQRVMAVNTWGVAATLGGFSAALARSGRGAVVVMASINGYKAHPKQVLYTASKHAAIGIMRAAALDLGRLVIHVNALAPGPIATDALQQRIATRHAAGGPDLASALAALDAEAALGKIATPRQVASAALWLASDASAGITGVVLPVEAGLG